MPLPAPYPTFNLERRQNTTNASPDAAELCENDKELNKESWEEFDLDPFLQIEVLALQPFDTGIQNRFIQLAGGIKNYACGVDTQCEITGSLERACSANPKAVSILTAMANFNNFFRAVRDTASMTLDSLSDGAADLVETFAPAADPEDTGSDATTQAGLGLTVIALSL